MADFSYLSLGAGIQSSTIAEMIVEGELPRVDLVLFADTGDEPDYVYDQVSYLGGRLESVGVKLDVVSNGNMVENLRKGSRRFAALPVFTVMDGKVGRMRRQCTQEYKIKPIEKRMRQELLALGLARENSVGAVRVDKGVNVECWLGISLDEVRRMKPNRNPKIENRWSLIDLRMSRHDCVRWLNERGLPVPRKSSCRVCPFHNDDHWRWMKDERVDDWQHVLSFDDWLRRGDGKLVASAKGELYLHRQCVPMDEVDLSTLQDAGQLELWDTCDEGYCYV